MSPTNFWGSSSSLTIRMWGALVNPLEPLLAQVFRVERRRIEAEEEEIEKLFFDATEQPIQRPSSKKPRREYYSGKQGDHTIKRYLVNL